MTSKYQDFSECLVVLGEPKCTSIFPTKGPHAGKETKVLEVLTYHPNFEKKADGSFERKEPDFYKLQYFGATAENMAKLLQKSMRLDVRGSLTTENFEKDGKQYENKVIKAKSIALCLNQLGIESIKFRAPEKKAGKSQTPELDR